MGANEMHVGYEALKQNVKWVPNLQNIFEQILYSSRFS